MCSVPVIGCDFCNIFAFDNTFFFNDNSFLHLANYRKCNRLKHSDKIQT